MAGKFPSEDQPERYELCPNEVMDKKIFSLSLNTPLGGQVVIRLRLEFELALEFAGI